MLEQWRASEWATGGPTRSFDNRWGRAASGMPNPAARRRTPRLPEIRRLVRRAKDDGVAFPHTVASGRCLEFADLHRRNPAHPRWASPRLRRGRNLRAPTPSSTPNRPTLPPIEMASSLLGINPAPGRIDRGLLQSPVNRGLPGSATPKMWGDATSKGYSTSSSSPVSDITPLMEPLVFVPMLVSGFRRFLTVLTPCLATILLTFGRLGSHSMVLARRSGRAMCRVCRPAALRPPFAAAVPIPRAKLTAPYGHPKTYTLSTSASAPNSRHSDR